MYTIEGMRKILFSIIIPTLNEERYVPRLLEDLQRQSNSCFEVIIVDGCSTDKTKQIALSYIKKLPIRFIQSKKDNVSYQRNIGAAAAEGNFLIFLDADCRLQTTCIKILHKYLQRTSKKLFLPILIPEDRSSRNRIIFKLINTIIETSHSLKKPLSAGGAIFIDRVFFKDLGGFDETLFMGEDHNVIQRAFKKKVKPTILKDVKVTFSTRRVKREGEIIFLYKSLFSLIYMLVNGKVRNKIFSYEMGGQAYSDVIRTKRIQTLFKKASAFLN